MLVFSIKFLGIILDRSSHRPIIGWMDFIGGDLPIPRVSSRDSREIKTYGGKELPYLLVFMTFARIFSNL